MTSEVEGLDLDALEKVAREATPGPWQLQDGCSWRRVGTRESDGNVLCPTTHHRDHHPDLCAGRGEDVYANLRHITTFDPPTVLHLLAALRAQAERVRVLEATLNNACAGEDHQWARANAEQRRAEAAERRAAELEGAMRGASSRLRLWSEEMADAEWSDKVWVLARDVADEMAALLPATQAEGEK